MFDMIRSNIYICLYSSLKFVKTPCIVAYDKHLLEITSQQCIDGITIQVMGLKIRYISVLLIDSFNH